MNVTRLYNSICAVSAMRRATALARDYAFNRKAFGKLLIGHPLHEMTLFLIELKVRECLLFMFYTGLLLEKSEKKTASLWEENTLRILTPVIKLYSGKMSSEVVKEGMECIEGVGYMESSGIPQLLRDTEVYSIWEGATNVLSLDVIRVISKSKDFDLEFLKTAVKSLNDNEKFIERLGRLKKFMGISKFYRKIALEIDHFVVAALFWWFFSSCGTLETKKRLSTGKIILKKNFLMCRMNWLEFMLVIRKMEFLLGLEKLTSFLIWDTNFNLWIFLLYKNPIF